MNRDARAKSRAEAPGGAAPAPRVLSSVPGALGVLLSAGLFLNLTASAQVMQPPGTFPQRHGVPPYGAPPSAQGMPATAPSPASSAAPAAPPAVSVPTQAPSLLDQPAEAAKVDIADGKLTVEANNSSLTAIFNQISTAGGMTIEGLNKDQRIFGTYGPGDPREIITQLLDGAGYNIVMFGRTGVGTPSQVSLTPRGAPLPQGNAYAASHPPVHEEEEEEPPPTQYQDNPPPQPNPNQAPGPGVPNNPNGGVRSPQQMLQELQQMRQQQNQQQPQPQQP
jgi:hypothetical protein